MPLLDHFHPPLHPRRHWESFHAALGGSLADVLNQRLLPEHYVADEFIHAGPSIEIDVAKAEDQVWTPVAPRVLSAAFPDHFEVLVFRLEGGMRLAAAIELVSPINKDRAERRRTFAVKCASYLVQGVGLIILDIVTSRRANLHNEILHVLEKDQQENLFPADVFLYTTAYRPLRREGQDEIDFWSFPLAVGETLPVLPLALHAELVLPIDFEAASTDACQRRRLT